MGGYHDSMATDDADAMRLHDRDAQLERALIADFLARKGHTFESVHALPADQGAQLLKEASAYASGRLTEVESRAHLQHDLHGAPES
jgi:hypothetical protein